MGSLAVPCIPREESFDQAVHFPVFLLPLSSVITNNTSSCQGKLPVSDIAMKSKYDPTSMCLYIVIRTLKNKNKLC